MAVLTVMLLCMQRENGNRWPQSDFPAYSPVREVKTSEFLTYPLLTGGQKWSEYEVKGPTLPRSSPMVSNDWCIIHVERVIDVWIRYIFDVIVLQFALLA